MGLGEALIEVPLFGRVVRVDAVVDIDAHSYCSQQFASADVACFLSHRERDGYCRNADVAAPDIVIIQHMTIGAVQEGSHLRRRFLPIADERAIFPAADVAHVVVKQRRFGGQRGCGERNAHGVQYALFGYTHYGWRECLKGQGCGVACHGTGRIDTILCLLSGVVFLLRYHRTHGVAPHVSQIAWRCSDGWHLVVYSIPLYTLEYRVNISASGGLKQTLAAATGTLWHCYQEKPMTKTVGRGLLRAIVVVFACTGSVAHSQQKADQVVTAAPLEKVPFDTRKVLDPVAQMTSSTYRVRVGNTWI